MGTWSRTLLVACALVTGSVTGAAGSDFRFPPAPVLSVPEAIPVPDYSSWYLRGDISYSVHEHLDISQSSVGFSNTEIEDTWGLGAGFGYNFRENIRGDITVDYRTEAEVSGVQNNTGARHVADLTSTVFLANLYYDFHGRDRLTPYIGAGVGFSINDLGNQSIQVGTTNTASTTGDDTVDLAAAAMAGLSYRTDDNWLIDVGYRFLYLGDAVTQSNTTAGAFQVDDIQTHEVRLGVRYELQ